MKDTISKLWYTFCPVFCPSQIALRKGFFREEFPEDEIELSYISALPVEEWQVHYHHRHPHLFREGGNVPPLWTRSEGVDTKVIGMVWSHEGQAILVNKDSPISSAVELKGKRIGLLRRPGNLIDFWRAADKRGIISALKVHGLTEDDIRIVDIPIEYTDIARERVPHTPRGWGILPRSGWRIPQQPAVEALHKGEVDAIFTFLGLETLLEQIGLARIIYSPNDGQDWRYQVNQGNPYVCTASGELARERPDLIVRWLKVLVRAGIWSKGNRDEVVSLISKATNVPPEVVNSSYPHDLHHNLVPEIWEEGIEALEMQRDFLKQHGFIRNNFDVRSWVDGSFLEAAVREVATEASEAGVGQPG